MDIFYSDNDEVKVEISYVFSNMTRFRLHFDLDKLFCELGVIECYIQLLQS